MNIFLAFALSTVLLFMLVGCTEKKESKTQDENIQTLEAVLQNSLTGPSDELKKILNRETEQKLKALNQHEEKLFKNYFANETSYTEFINSYGSTLMIQPYRDHYHFKIKDIEYEKVDAEDSVYNFTVELQLQKDSSEKSIVEIVTGQANLNDEHKIEDMVIHIQDLYKSLIQ